MYPMRCRSMFSFFGYTFLKWDKHMFRFSQICCSEWEKTLNCSHFLFPWVVLKEAHAGDGEKVYLTEIALCDNDHMLVVSESTYLVFEGKLIPRQHHSKHSCVCKDTESPSSEGQGGVWHGSWGLNPCSSWRNWSLVFHDSNWQNCSVDLECQSRLPFCQET